jgi:hypothetical protein
MAYKAFVIPVGCTVLFALQVSVALTADGSPNPIGRPPAFKQGKKDYYGVWYEDGQWNLRMTSNKDGKGRVVFTGMVKVDGDRLMGDFSALEKAKKAKDADWVVFHRDRRGFDFRFANRGAVDGVAFKAGPNAKSVTFKLQVSDDDDPRRILIGGNNAHPDKAEFTLRAHPDK